MKRTLVCMSVLTLFLTGCSGRNTPASGSSDYSSDISQTSAVSESTTEQSTAPAASEAETTGAAESDPPAEESDPAAEQLEHSREAVRENGCVTGAAFVGYIDSGLSEAEIKEFLANSETFHAYDYLDGAELVRREGAELYALTPLEDYSITVYPAELTEDCEISADRSAPLYQGGSGESIVLMCNISEIYSNVLVSVTNGSETVEFQPMLSMKDGRLAAIDGCYDLSIYEYPSVDIEDQAYESLIDSSEIQNYIGLGMVLRCTDEIVDIGEGQQALMFALGTDREDQFVNERYYAFGTENGTKYSLDPVSGEWGILAE